MAQIRLDRLLSKEGLGTRSEVKQLIKKGLVSVNGNTAVRPEDKADPDTDTILCKGERICHETFVYYMLNKPAGYLSATEDRHGRVVLDLIHEKRKDQLFPVGRLDIDTEGLLLLTNDGALAHDLLSPRKHVDKTYFALIAGRVNEEDVLRFEKGIDIGEDKLTMPAGLEILAVGSLQNGEEKTGIKGFSAVLCDLSLSSEKTGEEDAGITDAGDLGLPEKQAGDTEQTVSQVLVTIREGKYHQVKRMFEAVDKKVLYLKRIRMGSLVLDETLEKGAYRRLTEEEVEKLRKSHDRPE